MSAAVDPTVCPECGTPRAVAATRSAWAGRWRVGVQAAVLMTALLFVGWKNYEHWPVSGAPTRVGGSGTATLFLPRDRMTRDDIARYAAGERADGRLMRAFARRDALDSQRILVDLVQPAGIMQEHHRYGWPVMWLLYRLDGTYGDVYARSGLQPRPSGLRDGWRGWQHIRKGTDASGQSSIRALYPLNLAGSALVLVTAAYAGGVLRRLMAVGACFRGPWGCGGDVRWLPFAAVCLAAAIVLGLSARPEIERGHTFASASGIGAGRSPGVRIGELRTRSRDPGAEQWLAQRILAALPEDPPSADAVLATSWEAPAGWDHANAQGGWPAGLLSWMVQTVPDGPGAPVPTRFSSTIGRVWLEVSRHRTTPLESRSTLSIGLGPLSRLIFGLWLVWAGAGLWPRVMAWLHARRQRRLARAGCCVVCGYDLSTRHRSAPDHR